MTPTQPPLAPITAEMTVEAVLSRHPAMLKAFADAGFKPLLNPIMRRLFARATTLAGAARRKGWPDDRLVDFLISLNRLQAEAPVAAALEAETQPFDPVAVGVTERHDWGVFIDNRGLEPPQPMMRIMVLLETLAPGERLIAHNDRLPLMLLPRLEEDGVPYETAMQDDGSCRVTITKP
ncbi:MAG: DUF2249 domain-containing protein [Candidatus Sericytochromatia bacterium]